ncbi:hypothetical protein [Streptomyces sp. st115]|uniref:hypothetical protein n=1 Tax=Streptomyces sp. st115 TaxID=1828047 RepID=UPI00211D4929|nr:hypothetical protein [Streptomyces sp. st115]
MPFGVLVQLVPEVEGLLHISETCRLSPCPTRPRRRADRSEGRRGRPSASPGATVRC